jgi:hypothetical protein
VPGWETRVETQVEQIAQKGSREHSSEWSKLGSAGLNRENAPLIVTLVTGEEEGSIFTNRSTELIAELASLEERVRIAGVTLQAWIGSQVVIAIKEESTAVVAVAS